MVYLCVYCYYIMLQCQCAQYWQDRRDSIFHPFVSRVVDSKKFLDFEI